MPDDMPPTPPPPTNGAHAPAPTQQTVWTTVPCPKCKSPVRLPQDPITAVINHYGYTVITIHHPITPRCADCGQHYAAIFNGVHAINWNFIPIDPPPEANRVIVPDNIAHMPREPRRFRG